MPRTTHPALPHRGRFLRTLLALGLVLVAGTAAAEPLRIKVDRAKVMHISRPAATVIVGNPLIADATIQDRQTLIITGRSFGMTNLIVLDDAGEPVADELVSVTAADDELVTLYKRARRETYACSPSCEQILNVGDNEDVFDNTKTQIEGRNALAQGASGNGGN